MIWFRRFLLICFTLVVPGCGAKVYEQRLAHTVQYFKYEQKLNENLVKSRWEGGGVSWRVPKQMNLLPAPVTEDEEGNFIEVVDERQPRYLNGLELPGLEGAWEAIVEVDVNGELKDVSAHLYVTTNFSWFLAEEGLEEDEEALDTEQFNIEVAYLVASALGLEEPGDDQWLDERHPGGVKPTFVERKNYAVLGITVDKPAEHFGGATYDVTMYRLANGPVQTTIISVIPHGISPAEKIDERIALALETVKLTNVPPVLTSGGAGGGVGPGDL